MVLYRVYSQPHVSKYYSTVCSKATLFQIIIYAVMLIPPVFIAYETKGEVILFKAHGTFVMHNLTEVGL